MARRTRQFRQLPSVRRYCDRCGEETEWRYIRYAAFRCNGCNYTTNDDRMLKEAEEAKAKTFQGKPHAFRQNVYGGPISDGCWFCHQPLDHPDHDGFEPVRNT